MSLMGLDIGTSGCKAIVFAEDGAMVAIARGAYPLHTTPEGWLELDLEEVWTQAAGCIRQVNAQATHDPVRALAVSVLGEAVIAVDAQGKPLARSPVSFDGRALAQAEDFRRTFGAETAYALTGQPIHPMSSIHKIAWWRAQRPDLFAAAWKFLCYGDYVALKLGLPPAIDYSMAARTQAFDIRRLQWSEPILAWAGIEPERLAAPVAGGQVIGEIAPSAANDLGFRQGVLLVAGGHDQPCGALGSGALQPQQAMYALGTTATIAPTLPGPVMGLAKEGFACYPHVIPGSYITLAGTSSGGSLLRWFRDNFGDREQRIAQESGRDIYDVLMDLTGDGPGKLLLLPQFAGTEAPFLDPQARGALYGLSFGTTRADIVQAIVEGVALETATHLHYLRAAGVPISSLHAIGGGSTSARWMQLHADMLDIPILVPQVNEATGLGAALLAGLGAGCYDSLRAAVDQVIAIKATYAPRPEHVARYQGRQAMVERARRESQWIYPLLT
jgi:xylulokinase